MTQLGATTPLYIYVSAGGVDRGPAILRCMHGILYTAAARRRRLVLEDHTLTHEIPRGFH